MPAAESGVMNFTVAVTVPVFFESGEEPANRLREAGLRFGQMADGPGSPARLVELLDGADAVIASSTDPYIEEVLAALPRLKHVARWGVGYEAVDLAACTRHGVIATRVVGALTEAVADHAFALLLGLARRLAEGDHLIRRGDWQQLQGRSVAGKTLGLVGFGPIGQAVADRARGFRMRVLACDPYQSDEVLALHGAERAEFAALLAASDYVSLHAASTPETRHLLNATTLALLKPNAVLINTARGALVDE
ncbi:MAG: phosphoglycerate dehydrogenase, partial [Armatimonadetes bacterium]|nr:phosphoglycerate dehydrogenase [Armatimonadota bacterium]